MPLKFRCVECHARVSRLWIEYGPQNTPRLLECRGCGATADPFVEYELTTVMLFCLLGSRPVATHLLHNRAAADALRLSSANTTLTHALRAVALLGLGADGYIARSCVRSSATPLATAAVFGCWPWLLGQAVAGHSAVATFNATAPSRDLGRHLLRTAWLAVVSTTVFGFALVGVLRAVGCRVPLATIGRAVVLIKGLPVTIVATAVACGDPHPWHPLAMLALSALVSGTVVAAAADLHWSRAFAVVVAAWTASAAAFVGLGAAQVGL